MKKDTKMLIGMAIGGFVLIKVIIPRMPTLPGMAPRKPGTHAAYSNAEWAAMQRVAGTNMPTNTAAGKTQI